MPNRFHINRRSFLARCTVVAAATGLPLWFVKNELSAAENLLPRPAPNDRPGIALIGCGGMGRADAKNASRFGDIVAVCDVDETHAQEAAKEFTRDGKSPERFNDFRKVMEQKNVHIILQATPDHWHTLVNLAAIKAGKDVYGEKPLTLTLGEGKKIVQAVRDHKAVFQTGTQQRSDKKFRLACELVRNGRIGQLKQVTVFVPAGLRGGPFTPVPVPAGLNWDFWLGQAPKVDYLKERCFGTFRWWWDYSGGPVTDWGAHHNDIARWGIGEDGPLEIEATTITPPIPGGYTTPSEYVATLIWGKGVKQVVKTTMDDSPYGEILKPDGQRNGVKFEGTSGWIWVNRTDLSASDDQIISTPFPENALRLQTSNDHMGNFFECVRTRKDPISPVEAGHRSAAVGHLIVIALRTGQNLRWDPIKEVFTGKDAKSANEHVSRPMRAPYDYSFVS